MLGYPGEPEVTPRVLKAEAGKRVRLAAQEDFSREMGVLPKAENNSYTTVSKENRSLNAMATQTCILPDHAWKWILSEFPAQPGL